MNSITLTKYIRCAICALLVCLIGPNQVLARGGSGGVVDNGGGYGEMLAYSAEQLIETLLKVCERDLFSCPLPKKAKAQLAQARQIGLSLQVQASCGLTGLRSENHFVVSSCDLYDSSNGLAKRFQDVLGVVLKAKGLASIGEEIAIEKVGIFIDEQSRLISNLGDSTKLHLLSIRAGQLSFRRIALELRADSFDLTQFIDPDFSLQTAQSMQLRGLRGSESGEASLIRGTLVLDRGLDTERSRELFITVQNINGDSPTVHTVTR